MEKRAQENVERKLHGLKREIDRLPSLGARFPPPEHGFGGFDNPWQHGFEVPRGKSGRRLLSLLAPKRAFAQKNAFAEKRLEDAVEAGLAIIFGILLKDVLDAGRIVEHQKLLTVEIKPGERPFPAHQPNEITKRIAPHVEQEAKAPPFSGYCRRTANRGCPC